MTTQAVPIAPTVWILDRGDVWATLDQGELAERLSEEARNPLHWLLESVRDVKWTIECQHRLRS